MVRKYSKKIKIDKKTLMKRQRNARSKLQRKDLKALNYQI